MELGSFGPCSKNTVQSRVISTLEFLDLTCNIMQNIPQSYLKHKDLFPKHIPTFKISKSDIYNSIACQCCMGEKSKKEGSMLLSTRSCVISVAFGWYARSNVQLCSAAIYCMNFTV